MTRADGVKNNDETEGAKESTGMGPGENEKVEPRLSVRTTGISRSSEAPLKVNNWRV